MIDRREVSTLAGRIRGPVYTPGDAGFAPEITPFNTAVVHTPNLVVGAESAADVVEAVRFAREHRLSVTVQGTGHGAASPITSGLLVSTRRLTHVRVDPANRLAHIGGGASWAPVVAAAAPHGLAPIAGSSTTVGVSGYLLGGGLGPLARSHGFSSDYIVGLTVVTGAGDLVEASAEQNPDLFWALRGGKVGLGIVTEVRLRLVELRTLYAGSMFFEEANIEAVTRGWVDWTACADSRVTTSIAIIRFPPLEFIPAPLRGRRLICLRFAFPGAIEEGERLAAPLRALAPVYIDALGELAAWDIARIHNDPTEPGPGWASGTLLTHIDQRFASTLLEHVGAGTNGPFVVTEIRHLGGATQRDAAGGTSVGGRSAGFSLSVASRNTDHFQSVLPEAFAGLTEKLAAWISPVTNVNFVPKPRSAEHFASAWPKDVFARLTELRRKYDPDGVLAVKIG